MRLIKIATYCSAMSLFTNAQETIQPEIEEQLLPPPTEEAKIDLASQAEPTTVPEEEDIPPPNGFSNISEDQFTFINNDARTMMDKGDNEYFNKFVIRINEGIINALTDLQIVDEVKRFLDFAYSDEWINVVEMGTNNEVIENLGYGIDPLTNKLLGVFGPDMTNQLPIEMIQWIKDTTVLWIKNKGAGTAMSEEVAIEQNQVQQLNQQIREMRAYYDQQVKSYTKNLEDMENKLFELRMEIKSKDEKLLYQESLINEDLGQEEQIQNLIDQHQEEKNVMNQEKIQEMERIKANIEQQCTLSKRDILKTLNSKYQESTKKLTNDLNEMWQKKWAELKETTNKALQLDEGIRMTIKKNDQGIYYMKDIVRSDDSYELDGVIFEFTRADSEELFYMMKEKSKDEFCSDDADKFAIVEPEQEPEPVPEIKPFEFHLMKDYINTCMNDIVHHCDECSTHQLYDKVWDRHNCIDNHFCFLHHGEPHCGNCHVFGAGCKSCTYRNKCLQCHSGFWLMSGLCIRRPW